jgi:hypothetical protein
MASAVTVQEIFSKAKFLSYGISGTAPAVPSWFDMSQYGNFGIIVTDSVLTGSGLATVAIQGAVDSSGTSAQTIVTQTITPTTAQVGDFAISEIIADQLEEVGAANSLKLRYVGALVTLNNAGDKAIVTYIGWNPKFPQLNLSANVIH